MRLIRPKFTAFHVLLVIAVAAILAYLATDRGRSRAKERYERCVQIADWHGRIGAEYRGNAGGDAGMLQTAAWHEHMRREFERAAEQGGRPLPATAPFPPAGWEPSTEEGHASR